jgi:Tol biopolymer transport system component
MRFALLLIPAALAAQTPSIEQSLNFKTVSSPRISPDGRYIAYVVSEANWEDNSFQTQIWMAMTATGERYQLTHSKKSSSAPDWSPDSKRLAFLSDRESSQQIYVISPAGGEATQLTRFEGGVTAFEWAP